MVRGWVLGLVVMMEQAELQWRQRSVVSDAFDVVMQWTLFLCERLVGHLPMCGWLRLVCRILKRRASLIMKSWDDEMKDTCSSI